MRTTLIVHAHETDGADSHEVILEGGPAALPRRIRVASTDIHKIKIQHYGGYEHYVRLDDNGADATDSVPRFRWSGRTAIAE